VLELVEKKLLRMRPKERADCGQIVERLREINERCKDNGYCIDPVSKPQRAGTNLSELTATPLLSSLQENSRLQRTGTNLSELMATPLPSSLQNNQQIMKKPDKAPITEHHRKMLDIEYADPSKSNGYHSPHKTRRVSTAPELWKSSYNTEQVARSAPERITEHPYTQDPMDVEEGMNVSMGVDAEQVVELSSSEKIQFDGGREGFNTPPLPTRNSDDSALDMTYDQTTESVLDSTRKKRDVPKEDGEETTGSHSTKRVRR
jgi:hypothetical protein